MISGFVDASEFLTNALIALERLASFSVKLLQTMLHPILSKLSRDEVSKEKNRELCYPSGNYVVESSDKESRSAGRSEHSSNKVLVLDCM